MALLALLVLAGFALYVMKPDERVRLLQWAIATTRRATHAAVEHTAKEDPFSEELRARTKPPLVVPALITYNVVIFVCMLFGSGSFGDPATLVAWGANFGPRTSNGEWSRLLASMFVHAGFLHLIATIAGLTQAGFIMERLVGYVIFSAVYLMAGLCASVVSLGLHPMDASVGASGAVFGVYGFLTAMSVWGVRRQSGVSIPLQTAKTFAPAAGVFLLYNLFGGLSFAADIAGFVAGGVAGVVLARDIGERKPAPRRIAATVASTFGLAALIAIPQHGITDLPQEVQAVVRVEDATAAQYEKAVEQFRKGIITAGELAGVIKLTIVPELESARVRVAGLGRVPQQHQPLLARTQEFLQLRRESWRLRATALEEGNMGGLREADRLELTSFEALDDIKNHED